MRSGELGIYWVVMWTQRDLIQGWYTDLALADNDLVIDLSR